jgi:hypothetical protein
MPFNENNLTGFPLGYRRARRSRVYSKDGKKILLAEFYFDSRGLPHRDPDEGPAIRRFNFDGSPYSVEYRWHGLLHRDGAPARLVYEFDGQTFQHQSWYRFGRIHRRDGPAWIERHVNGLTKDARWYLHSYRFRDPQVGPWMIWYNDNGTIRETHMSEEIPSRPEPTLSWLRTTFGRQLAPLEL